MSLRPDRQLHRLYGSIFTRMRPAYSGCHHSGRTVFGRISQAWWEHTATKSLGGGPTRGHPTSPQGTPRHLASKSDSILSTAERDRTYGRRPHGSQHLLWKLASRTMQSSSRVQYSSPLGDVVCCADFVVVQKPSIENEATCKSVRMARARPDRPDPSRPFRLTTNCLNAPMVCSIQSETCVWESPVCPTPCRSAVWAPPSQRRDSTPMPLRRPDQSATAC